MPTAEGQGVTPTWENDLPNHIQNGDLIVRIDSTKVENPADAAEAVRKATKAGKKAVLVQINRDGNTALIPVPLAKGDG